MNWIFRNLIPALEQLRSALALLSTDSAGTVVASASEAGTVVKVWCSRDGTLLHELRRGVHPTQISCMTFRDDARYLAVASASPTVHVFKLDGSKDGEKDADLDEPYSRDSLSGFAGSAISAITANAPEVRKRKRKTREKNGKPLEPRSRHTMVDCRRENPETWR